MPKDALDSPNTWNHDTISENCLKIVQKRLHGQNLFGHFCLWSLLLSGNPVQRMSISRHDLLENAKVEPSEPVRMASLSGIILSEPPKRGRKTGAARKLSKNVENMFDTF